jgi:hypothetical protein
MPQNPALLCNDLTMGAPPLPATPPWATVSQQPEIHIALSACRLSLEWLASRSFGRSVGRSVKLLLAFASTLIPGLVSSRTMTNIFVLSCFEIRRLLRRGRDRSFCVGDRFVAPQFQHEYIRTLTASRSLWTLCTLCYCTILSNIYTRYRGFLSMQACAAGYVLTYVNILKLHSVSWTVVCLTATKFKPLILPMPGFSFSDTTYIWNYMVWD